jgi:UDP-glucose:(heptosyl)LPS alpha-1,3-glucosyltransferase
MRVALSAPDVNLAGGIERIIVETANWLSRFGHEVTVYGARVDRSVLDDRIEIREIKVPGGVDVPTGLGFRRRAARAIRRDRPDVHGAFSSLSPRGGVFWAPSVHRVGYDLLLSRRPPVRRLPVRAHPFHRVRLRFERQTYDSGYERLMALSENVRQDAARCYGVAPDDVEVLPPGFDPVVFDPERRSSHRRDARATFGFGSDDRVVLFVANELERKGFDVLLEAVARLGDPDVKILGAGRAAPDAYGSEIERLGLADRLRWVGSSNDVPLLHAASDVFALPTRYEAWGMVIVEALASGLPVVTTSLAGAALAVRDGVTGKLANDPDDASELAEALRWALSSAPVGPEKVAASVSKYTWERIVARYEQVLESVVTERSCLQASLQSGPSR